MYMRPILMVRMPLNGRRTAPLNPRAIARVSDALDIAEVITEPRRQLHV